MRAAPLFGLLLFAAACATTSPAPIRAGDVCFNCRRTITDPSIAAELIDQGARAFKFRSVACLTEYLRDHPGEPVKAIFVTDYGTGKMFPATDAYYVKFVVDASSNGLAFAAFRAESAAQGFSAEKRSPVVVWDDVQKDHSIVNTD